MKLVSIWGYLTMKPPWNYADYADRERIENRLEAERVATGAPFEIGRETTTQLSAGALVTTDYVIWRQLPAPVELPRCGARTKRGTPCRRSVAIRADGNTGRRCSIHGGLSTGPRTAAGRERQSAAVASANRKRKGTRYKCSTPQPTARPIGRPTPQPQPRRAAAPTNDAELLKALLNMTPDERKHVAQAVLNRIAGGTDAD